MSAPRVLVQLVRADFLERVRRHSFLVTLGFTLYAAYMFLPPNPSRYATLNLGGHRGIYNSAWVGTVVSMLSVSFLSLAGFYLVKNALERDRRTGVGQILAATPLPGALYLLGKMLSNLTVLAVMVGVLAVAAYGMQLLRGEDTQLRLLALVSPFVLVTLPVMALVAAVAVCFEVIPWLRGGVGNIAYFVLWMTTLSLSGMGSQASPAHPLGIGVVLPQMQADCAAAFDDFPATGGRVTMGFNIKAEGLWHLQTFAWEGIRWTPPLLGWRAFWGVVSVALTLLMTLFFDRFEARRVGAALGRGRRVPRGAGREAERAPTARGSAGSLSRLADRVERSRLASLVMAELRIALHGVSRWWFLVALTLATLCLFVPLPAVRQFVLPFAVIWPMLLWSPMGTRERRHGTDALLFSAPRPVVRLLVAQWLAGVLIALAATSGAMIRFGIGGESESLVAVLVGAAFVPSLALAFGIWSGSAKLFEVIYLLLWYAGPMNRIPPIDFVGTTQPGAGTAIPVAFLAVSGALLGLAVLGRRRQIRQ